MKKIAFATVGIVAALALTACSGGTSGGDAAPSKELNIYAWDGEIPQTVIDAFTEETGIKVNLDNFDSNETMISKLAAGGSGYDVVQPSQYAVQQLVGQELLEPLDHSKLEGLENIAEKFADPSYDPGMKHSVPWVWGTTGLLYNSTCTGGEEITSWESLFDPKWQGKVYMLDNMLAAYIAGLQVNGYGADSKDEKEIAKATESLIEQKSLLAGYNSTNYGELVANGDACISEAWGGNSTAKIVADNEDVHYVIPEEGGSLWVDGLSIAKGAPHSDAAYKFINFLLQPEIAAMATNDGGMATPNTGAQEFITDKGLLTNAAVYPTEEQIAEADFIVDPGAAMKFYQDGWTRVKAS
ncbi:MULTISPECIES: PotD/PotF family extracellular solute-binding protein [unclassified Leucobacter]|uniref:ABC transporter substrate-binding protein n=1 Tax=unclassified Leucobacter TaxID=2621730 RepID=UPI00165E27B5|nr:MULTISPECIES: spermidine/putrescine ABC transporter substrate-binding protein [unclassified Leucobacter]MBC9928623.1 spermidine/putrescine ABC transporter substrate-binding protein [Leucobacter sp. cx-169]MBC9937554.1 spermidine/putrescine ABC transporter substrate-binding protein [Leucobacter sp. cx-87]